MKRLRCLMLFLLVVVFLLSCTIPEKKEISSEKKVANISKQFSKEKGITNFFVYQNNITMHNAFYVNFPLNKSTAEKVALDSCGWKNLKIGEKLTKSVGDCKDYWNLEVKAEGHCRKHVVNVCVDKPKVFCEGFAVDQKCEDAKKPKCSNETKKCPDGTILTLSLPDCKFKDCPKAPATPKNYKIENGTLPEKTITVSFPLDKQDALKVGMAACGVDKNSKMPPNVYENVLSQCFNAWDIKDNSNPCDVKRAIVCENVSYVKCSSGGQTGTAECINRTPLIQKEYHPKFLVFHPINLSQTKKFSRFRSCSGHDYSGYNVKGELETERSMKHYIRRGDDIHEMHMYAPFNGTVYKYYAEQKGNDYALEIRGDHSGKWLFEFGHMFKMENLKLGDKVTAGQLVGSTKVGGPYGGTEIALYYYTDGKGWTRDTPFNYMSDELLRDYAARGLTPENMIFTKEERDADPCRWKGEPAGTWVSLKSS